MWLYSFTDTDTAVQKKPNRDLRLSRWCVYPTFRIICARRGLRSLRMVTIHASACKITHPSLGVTPLFTGECVFPSEIWIIDCKDLSAREIIWLTDVYLMLGESGSSELKSIDRCLGEMWCKLKSFPPRPSLVGWFVLWCIDDEEKLMM